MHDEIKALYDSQLMINVVTAKRRGSFLPFSEVADGVQGLLVLLLRLIYNLNFQKCHYCGLLPRDLCIMAEVTTQGHLPSP